MRDVLPVEIDARAVGLAPADLIFVFGTRLRAPAVVAADLFGRGLAPRIVVTGGLVSLTGTEEGRVAAHGRPSGARGMGGSRGDSFTPRRVVNGSGGGGRGDGITTLSTMVSGARLAHRRPSPDWVICSRNWQPPTPARDSRLH